MRTLFGRWLLAACLVAPGLTGTLPAAEGDPAPPDPRRRVYETLREVINQGADLYNGGNATACCYLYQGALMTLPQLLDHRPDLRKAVRMGLADAQREPGIARRAFALRAVIDQVYNASATPAEETTAAVPAPVAKPLAPTRGLDSPPPAAKVETPKPPSPEPKTLWEKLGGAKGVTQIADDFVDMLLQDKRVNFTRDTKYKLDEAQVKQLKQRLVELARSISSGKAEDYHGNTMKEAHKGMGITDLEFDACLEDLQKVLSQNGVKDEVAQKLRQAVEGTRKSIVEVPNKPPTLLEQLGGEEGVTQIADHFVKLALEDKRVNFTRNSKYKLDEAQVKQLKQRLVELARSISSGNAEDYPGKSMKEVHKGMGITDLEFDACLEDLKEALKSQHVKDEVAQKLLKAVESTRKNIVEAPK